MSFSQSSYAGRIKGTVKQLHLGPYIGTTVLVQLVPINTIIPSASCATHNTFKFAFDVAAEGGEALFSTLLAAQKSSAVIEIGGQNRCTVLNVSEDIRWINAF
jgi:hypothetical protein